MHLSDFDYELPEELIAQHPSVERGHSRLMHVDAVRAQIADRRFADLPRYVAAGDVVVLNDTRVLKARLHATKTTGGQVEILVERLLDARSALVMLRASRKPRPGERLTLRDGSGATVGQREGDLFELRFDEDAMPALERLGEIPLPPYIARPAGPADEARYQTVYATAPGAIAAPTAGLHFDEPMLARLRDIGAKLVTVTLHVGAGTFQPVKSEDVEQHVMHKEWYRVPEETARVVTEARAAGRRILAVGTTSLRALESACAGTGLSAGSAETRLFITPGYRFRVVDRLLTNFHLPRSTLFMLVAAFAGLETIRAAYRHAVEQRYRFFSYGDAMLIERAAA
jgi:S-adenosylmethionine:tRNA ribosyltransferase-isomerase